MPLWSELVPELAATADDITRRLYDEAGIIELPAKSTVFMQGDSCRQYLVVLKGTVKVFTRAENGREILLYRLVGGDSCVLTTSCLFSHSHYPAEGKTETDVIAMAIPASQFEFALQQSSSFREQVFATFSSHLTELIALVEEVAFGKLDIRLARYLLTECDASDTVLKTHQQIATDLGTAREVVSRQLKDLESEGVIELKRGAVSLRDKPRLEHTAAS
jgi:CRP/FNR family transcriptional regulator